MTDTNHAVLEGLLELPASDSANNRESSMSGNETLLEYFRSAREEVLTRVKYRDNWLTMQFLAQVVLFALAQGVEVVGVRSSQPNSSFLFLCVPISLLLASLYHVEDSIIGYLGNYICAIPDAEVKVSKSPWVIRNWDSSEQFRLYGVKTLPIRLVAQITAFLVIPIGLFALRIFAVQTWGLFQIVEISLDVLLLFIICFVLARGFLLRRKINNRYAPSIVDPTKMVSSK